MNVCASFDIEATSFYMDESTGECIRVDSFFELPESEQKRFSKYATMCAWGFGLNGKVLFGRTWEEFIALLKEIQNEYYLSPDEKILPVYVMNLSYEFQWMRKLMKWKSVFATRDRYPIRALCEYGIEFRDALILSGMSLESTAKSLLKYKVQKLVGDWDYLQLRGTKTRITKKEWGYLENDNMVVMAYIRELLEEYQDINKIPMTKTGFVREDVRNACYWDKRSHKKDNNHKFVNYRSLMNALRLDGAKEYTLCKKAFAGGFTHAGSLNSNTIHFDVISLDISSSYPAVICSEKFPMGRGMKKEIKTKTQLKEAMRDYCCIMDITFYEVEEAFIYEHIISQSKCVYLSDDAELDNGRVIRAKELRICITEIDFECFERFYKWKGVKVHECYCYHRNYLPKEIIAKTLEYYEGKTTLKGVEGKESEYSRLKTLVNSIFGMMVQDPFKNEIAYSSDDEWELVLKDVKEEIEKYNDSSSRFLFYPWGIYITAYARRNILSAILECKEDYIYTDTDSVKFKHYEKHKDFFERYNAIISRKIKIALDYRCLDYAKAHPKSQDGEEKPLGIFDFDGKYYRFKTLGAKRYAIDYGEPHEPKKPWTRYSLTISGVNKKVAIPEIYRRMQESGKDFFDYFKFGTLFDRKMCGKKLHTYIDEPQSGILTDKDGKRFRFSEASSVHLEETTYEMTGSDEYISLLDTIQSIMYID